MSNRKDSAAFKALSRHRRCPIARLEEVVITRESETAIIGYLEEGVPTTHFRIGPELSGMTDNEVLDFYNASLRTQAEVAARLNNAAIEVPIGLPQIEYSERGNQWVPRGNVLRCHISDDDENQATIMIDDQELNTEEFGRMLVTYAGWGMRIEFVPDEEVHQRPKLVLRDPDND